jgi:hypothetical protein
MSGRKQSGRVVPMSNLVTDINFFPNETVVKLDNGDELSFIPKHPDGTPMTLEELRECFFLVEHNEIYLNEIEDVDD